MCLFCDEFEKGYFELEGKNYGNRVIFASENFVVLAPIGQIVEGYLLIVSKAHYVSMGHIPENFYVELGMFIEKVKKLLKNNYTKPIFFEHGAISESKGVCCINHAHIHAVPVDVDIFDELSAVYKDSKRIYSFDLLKESYNRKQPYFYYENNLGAKYLFNIPHIVPSQQIRQIVAKKIGKQERWDWRTYYGLDDLVRTIEKLKSI